MPEFLYELHTHEKSVSACGRFSPDELAGLYADLGYAGLCVTDHWFNGNTAISADLSWTERVDAFARGWEAVKNAGDRRGLDVFFGFEYSYKGTDFLIFDLDAAWMKKNPDIISMSTTDFLTKARADGGFVIQAHPYREEFYIDHIRLFPHCVDAVEVLNMSGSMKEAQYKLAVGYAEAYGLIKTAGSDAHYFDRQELAAIAARRKASDISDLVSILRQGDYSIKTVKNKYFRP